MKNESFIEENDKPNKRIDRVLKFSDPNANYPNKHKLDLNKNKIKKYSDDSDRFDFQVCWYIFASFILMICLLYFVFFVGFPVKRANILASEYGKKS